MHLGTDRCCTPGRVRACLLLALIPLGVAAVHPDSAFSPLFHDSWLYHGYFLDLPGHLRAFGNLYYSSRLSMTLPGWLAYKALPPVWANHALHLGVYLMGAVSLYFVLRRTAGARAALLAALLLGGHHFFQLAAASDYCDGYAMGYFLLACASCTQAAHSDRWRAWLFLAGVAAAALVAVNLMLGLLVLPLAAHHVLANRAGRRQPLDTGGFWVGAGAGCLLGGLSLFSTLLGGPFWFLAPSFDFGQQAVQHANPFKRPLLEWLPHADWLVWPAAAAVGAVVFLARRRPGRPPLAAWYQVQLLALVAVLAGTECSPRYSLLQVWLYAGPFLVPVSFLALGGQWAGWLDALPPGAFAWLAGCAALSPIAVAALPARPDLVLAAGVLAVAALAGVLVPLLASRRVHPGGPDGGDEPRRSPAGAVAGAAALALLAAAEAGLRQGFRMDDALPHDVAHGLRIERVAAFDGQRRQVFESIHQAMRQIRALDPGYSACYWFDIDETFGLLFDNIACLHCWGRLVNTNFPELHPEWAPLRPGMRLLVLSADPAVVERLRRALGPRGLEVEELRQRGVGLGHLGFGIHLVETSDGLSAHPYPRRGGGS
jgi:hypothetical protein